MRPNRATSSATLAEGAIADDGVLRVRVDVEDGRVVQVDADCRELGRQRLSEAPRELLVAAAPERTHRGPLGERALQTRDAPAFLVDAHPERQLTPESTRLPCELGHLRRLDDVAREEDDAAEIELTSQRLEVGGQRVAVEARDQQLPDVTPEVPL